MACFMSALSWLGQQRGDSKKTPVSQRVWAKACPNFVNTRLGTFEEFVHLVARKKQSKMQARSIVAQFGVAISAGLLAWMISTLATNDPEIFREVRMGCISRQSLHSPS